MRWKQGRQIALRAPRKAGARCKHLLSSKSRQEPARSPLRGLLVDSRQLWHARPIRNLKLQAQSGRDAPSITQQEGVRLLEVMFPAPGLLLPHTRQSKRF